MGAEVEVRKKLPRNLVKRGDVYYVRKMIDGKRVWRSTGHTTLRSAERKADEIKVQLRNEEDFGRTAVPTFRDWILDYQQTYSRRKKSGWRDKYTLDPAVRSLGRYRLDEITPSIASRYLNGREGLVADSTINLERAILRSTFERAVDDGLIDKNPWKKTEKRKTGPRVRVLSPENERLLRGVMSPLYRRWLTFMLGTGLRIAEAATITPAEIDWDKKLIRVPEEGAKFGKARKVPLRPEVEAVIEAQLKEKGRLWNADPRTYWKRLKLDAKAAGIPHLGPHDLRHTFATRFLQGGGDIYILSQILGHASVKTTEETYVHLKPTDLVERSRHVDLRIA